MKTYMVKNIFGPTIQGEGSASGTVVHFVRFAGCNMWDGRPETRAQSQCPFCDTDFRGGERLTIQEIITKLRNLGSVQNIVLSGGEPALQANVDLIAALQANKYIVHIETNGSRVLPDGIDHVTCSPKRPREELKIEWAHDLKLLFPPIKQGLEPEAFLDFPAENKFLQPVDDVNSEANLKATIAKLYTLPGWRLSLQTHKIIGVE